RLGAEGIEVPVSQVRGGRGRAPLGGEHKTHILVSFPLDLLNLVLLLLVLAQYSYYVIVETHRADRAFRLRLTEDVEHASVQVHIGPPQLQRFAEPQASIGEGVQQGINA